jgi:DNA-3-methyladenine glycosylase
VTGGRSSRRRLGPGFFDRPTARVARELLGAVLSVRSRGATRSVRLVETEAYVRGDPASHAYRGPTPRNRAMFGPPGTLYVYRIHQVVCANLVTRPGEAVLLRAGVLDAPKAGVASGPGRLCRALGITLADDGQDATHGGRLAVAGRVGQGPPTAVGPRIGLRRAVDRPLRFAIRGEREVSRPRPPGWSLSGASPRSTRAAGASRRTRRRRTRPSAGGRSGARTDGR